MSFHPFQFLWYINKESLLSLAMHCTAFLTILQKLIDERFTLSVALLPACGLVGIVTKRNEKKKRKKKQDFSYKSQRDGRPLRERLDEGRGSALQKNFVDTRLSILSGNRYLLASIILYYYKPITIQPNGCAVILWNIVQHFLSSLQKQKVKMKPTDVGMSMSKVFRGCMEKKGNRIENQIGGRKCIRKVSNSYRWFIKSLRTPPLQLKVFELVS